MFLFVVALTSYLSKKIGYSLLEKYFFCQAFLLVCGFQFEMSYFIPNLKCHIVLIPGNTFRGRKYH
jgi:hypothetical protein